MKETLQNILIADENNYGLKIRNQNFSNEIIFEKEIFTGIIDRVNFSNCQFNKVDLLSNSFLNSTFKRCKTFIKRSFGLEKLFFKNIGKMTFLPKAKQSSRQAFPSTA